MNTTHSLPSPARTHVPILTAGANRGARLMQPTIGAFNRTSAGEASPGFLAPNVGDEASSLDAAALEPDTHRAPRSIRHGA